ncbi:MAG: macro domain-containing protein [Alphaproteobacteria bacterium]
MKINNIEVNFISGDITKLVVDAYIIPQFFCQASTAGVGGAVMRSGALEGIEAYQKYIDKNGNLNFGEGIITKSGGGNSNFLLHVASVDSGKENEFQTIQKAIYTALYLANQQKLSTIATPALGTLSAEQSAKAIFSAIDQFSKTANGIENISLVFFNDPTAIETSKNILLNDLYHVQAEEGAKTVDYNKVHEELLENGVKNVAFFNLMES